MAKKRGVSIDRPKPSLYIDGAMAKKLSGHPVGKSIRMTVHGTVSSHSIRSDGNKRSHSSSIEIHRISPVRRQSTRRK